MASDGTKALLLQIDANVALLKSNLAQGDAAVASFVEHTEERLEIVDLAFEKLGDHVKEHAVEIGGAVAGIFAIEALVEFAAKGLELAASLGEVAQQLGVTARDLQVFRYAASQVGISTEDMDKGLQKFTKSLGSARAGSEEASKIFKAIGFSDDQIKHLDVHDALLKTADGIAAVGDRATRAVPETQLFGRAGQQLDTLFAGGSKGIEAFAASAEKLGLIIPDEFLERAAVAEHKVSELKQVLSVNIANAVAQNADAITTLATALEAVAVGAAHAVQRFSGFVTIAKSEGLIAAFAANGQEKDQAGTDEGNLQRQLVNFRTAQQTYLQTPGSPEQQRNFGERIAALKAAALKVSSDKEEAEAARKLGEQQGKGDGLGGVLAPKGKSAADLAKEAEEARKREVERQKKVADEEAKLDDEYLTARSGLTANADEQAVIARKRLATQTAAKNADLDSQVSDGRVKGAEEGELRARIARNAAIELDAINQKANIRDQQDTFALANKKLDLLKDELGSQEALATTAKARREIELRILAAEKANEQAQLEAVSADKNRKPSERHYSDEQIAEADASLADIDKRYDGKAAGIEKDTQGPAETYLKTLNPTKDERNELIQTDEVKAFQSLNTSLDSSITKSLHLHGIFGNIVQDLIDMAVKQALIKPLANAFLGKSGDGGGGGIFGSIGKLLGHGGGGGAGFGNPLGADDDFFSGFGGFADGGDPARSDGRITGPGTGRSDSILAMTSGGKPIRVANGESIVTADATSKYWPMIKAMNAGQVPRFADGGLPSMQSPEIRAPKMPDLDAIGQSRQPVANHFDLRGAVVTQDLLDQMNGIANAHVQANKPATVAAGAHLAAQNAGRARRRALG